MVFTDQIGKEEKKPMLMATKAEQVLKKNAGNKADNVVENTKDPKK